MYFILSFYFLFVYCSWRTTITLNWQAKRRTFIVPSHNPILITKIGKFKTILILSYLIIESIDEYRFTFITVMNNGTKNFNMCMWLGESFKSVKKKKMSRNIVNATAPESPMPSKSLFWIQTLTSKSKCASIGKIASRRNIIYSS